MIIYLILIEHNHSLHRYVLQGKSQNVWKAAKQEFTKVAQQSVKESTNDSKLISFIFKFGFGGLGVTTACLLKPRNQIVICREAKIVSDIKSENPELTFKWKKFFKYLYPHIWYLVIALSVSIYNF